MGRAKEIVIKVIPASVANPFVKKNHYSGKAVNNSKLHFGAFLDGNLHGVMSFGSPMDRRKIQGLVSGTGWNEFLELNRMAFDDYLPRNSESYSIGKAIRLIKQKAPHIKWIVSFADGTQCGDGTIYRASNFILTGIRENKTILEFPTGDKLAALVVERYFDSEQVKKQCRALGMECRYRTRAEWIRETGGAVHFLPGYMLRYMYFIDKTARQRLTVPEIPFSKIDEMKAGMYKGEKITMAERHVDK